MDASLYCAGGSIRLDSVIYSADLSPIAGMREEESGHDNSMEVFERCFLDLLEIFPGVARKNTVNDEEFPDLDFVLAFAEWQIGAIAVLLFYEHQDRGLPFLVTLRLESIEDRTVDG
ncbi:hypothetical protein ACWGNE_15750 [Streptomyces xiamenensis]